MGCVVHTVRWIVVTVEFSSPRRTFGNMYAVVSSLARKGIGILFQMMAVRKGAVSSSPEEVVLLTRRRGGSES